METIQRGKVKRMEKGTATFVEPYVDREGYHEVTVTKNFWKCVEYGLVWTTRHDAEECGSRGHKLSYTKSYGGQFMNGRLVNARVYTIHSVRKEEASL